MLGDMRILWEGVRVLPRHVGPRDDATDRETTEGTGL